LLAALVFILARALDPQGDHTGARKWLVAAFGVPSAVLAFLVPHYDFCHEWALILGALVIGAVVLWATPTGDVDHQTLPWVVLTVWTLCGGGSSCDEDLEL
jgi:hypothetical protein